GSLYRLPLLPLLHRATFTVPPTPAGACLAPKSAMGPRTAWSRCCWVHSVTRVHCTASHCTHSAMCHFQVSSHSCWFPFCHRLLYGLPLLLPPPPHCGSKHWVLAP
ncbi:unnamed protein product, partial [Staurois parvus]